MRDTQITGDSVKSLLAWSEQTIAACRAAVEQHSTCELKPRPRGEALAPFTDPSCRAAKASGLIVRLPQEEIRELSALDDRVDIEERFFEIQQQPARRVQAFYRRFGNPEESGTGWQHASPEEIERFVEVLDVWDGDLRNMSFINREAHDEAASILRTHTQGVKMFELSTPVQLINVNGNYMGVVDTFCLLKEV